MQKKESDLNLIDLLKRHVLRPVVLRRMARAAAWATGILAVAAAMVMLVLHVWILPRVNEFRPWIEQSASSALGLRVQIGEIVVVRQGVRPAVQVRALRLLDEEGNEGLYAEMVEAEASVFTLARRRLARLAVIRPVLHAWRNADGRIYLAGLALPVDEADRPAADGDPDAALNWLLRQPRLYIQNGSIQWSDARRQVAPLAISQIQASVKSSGRRHRLQLSFTPPAGWGQAIVTSADWTHDQWEAPARWNKWSGTVQADIPQLDVSQLRQYVDLGKEISLRQGQGSLHLQAEYREGRSSSLKIRTGLQSVDMTLGKNLPALALKRLDGTFRLHFRQGEGRDSYTFDTEGLAFETHDDLRWPGGNVHLSYHDAVDPKARGGEIQGNDWDIGIISQLAGRLPLGDAMLRALQRYQPRGQVHALQLGWQGDLNAPSAYTVRGRASQIGWLAQPNAIRRAHDRPGIGTPGLQGARIAFEFTQAGGHMDLNLDQGSAEFPGIFEIPRLAFETFQTRVYWTIQGQQIRVALPEIRLSNRDVQASVQMSWKTYDGAQGEKRFPGVLDLKGTLQRARAEQVVRYLPLDLGQEALDYVGNAVRSGDIRNAQVRINGDLDHVPFGRDSHGVVHEGVFRFDVPLINAEYRFVPRYLQEPSEKPWPALVRLNGTLVIDKSSLSVLNATARFSTAPDVVVSKLSAHIPDLGHNLTVGIAASMRGPLEQAVKLTNGSPLSTMLGDSLTDATATGMADIALVLGLPIMHMDNSIVRGSVKLQNNDVRITPGSPLLARSQGQVQFNEKGFVLQGVSTTLLGGRATLKGGSEPRKQHRDGHRVRIDAQGDFTGEGLLQETSLGTISQLGRFLKGRSAYRATLLVNRGASELTIDSDLGGMAIKLPAPLGKEASGRLPFHYSSRIVGTVRARDGVETAVEDELQVRFGQVVLAQYVRDLRHGDDPRVLRGRVAVGAQAVENAPPMPEAGVHALVRMDSVDAGGWSAALESGWGDQVHAARTQGQPAGAAAAAGEAISGSYLPDQFAVQTPLLRWGNRTFDSLVVGGARKGRLWTLSIAAKQLNGHVEYLPSATGGPGGVKARLQHLTIEPVNVQEVGEYVRQTADPQTLPYLDIDAANVELLGHPFDRVVLRASNSAQARPAGATLMDEAHDGSVHNAWRIHELLAVMPQARLHGSGVWGVGVTNTGGKLQPADLANRYVALQVRAQTGDLGETLERLGFAGLLKGGRGSVTGTLRWDGSPVAFDLETLAGELRIDVRQGHVTRVDPGALKLVSLLSLQGLTRLGDMAEKGFAFDRIDGSLRIRQGKASTSNLSVVGAMADVKVNGQVDLPKSTLDMDVVVQPKLDLSTAALAATAIHPLAGMGSYVAQWMLSKPINAMAAQVLRIEGPLDNPAVIRLQGEQAARVAQSVLHHHAAPTAFNPLWDWYPITGPQLRTADPLLAPQPPSLATPLPASQAEAPHEPASHPASGTVAQPAASEAKSGSADSATPEQKRDAAAAMPHASASDAASVPMP